MDDPRLGGGHLELARHDQYDATVSEMLNFRGDLTSCFDPLVRPPVHPRAPARREAPLGGTYTLVSLTDGSRHPLRVGINTIGRFPSNDIVLEPMHISRRHCVVVVHATGPCEVYDTASFNGVYVNDLRVARADLRPSDVLMLCDQQFRVDWTGPNGEPSESAAGSKADFSGCLA